MRTVLVQPPLNSDLRKPSFPLGLLSLAAALRRAGRDAEVYDFGLEVKSFPDRFKSDFGAAAVAMIEPDTIDVLGVGSMTCNFHLALEIALAFKACRPEARVVIGGPHATFAGPEIMARYSFLDAVCVGESEETVVELWRDFAEGALRPCPGAYVRGSNDEAVWGGARASLSNLDALPIPAYDAVDVTRYLAYEAIAWLEVGRGCPFKCNFCSTAVMWEHKYRVKSPARVLDEIRLLVDNYGVKETNFLHDNLTVHKKYLKELCAALTAAGTPVGWYCTSRADHLKRAQVEAMRDAGCLDIFFGIESMDFDRHRWLKKNLRPDRVRQTLSEVVASGVKPSLGFIIGFPDETDAERDATFGYALDLRCDAGAYLLVSYLQIYPGAPLYDELVADLRPSPISARNNAVIPGHRPPETLDLGVLSLFPTLGSFRPEDEVERVISWRNILSVLLDERPHDLRAHLREMGRGVSAFLRAMSRHGSFLEEDGAEAMRGAILTAFELESGALAKTA